MQAALVTNQNTLKIASYEHTRFERAFVKCHVVYSNSGQDVIVISQAFASRIRFKPNLSSNKAFEPYTRDV